MSSRLLEAELAVACCIQAAKQILDQVLPKPVSYADLVAIVGPVGIYQTHGPLINVGYGRPDTDGPDTFTGVGSNTNQQRDYPITEIITEWGEPSVLLTGDLCHAESTANCPFDSIEEHLQCSKPKQCY